MLHPPGTRIFDDNALSIGRTPLVRLNRLAAGLPATVVVKVVLPDAGDRYHSSALFQTVEV